MKLKKIDKNKIFNKRVLLRVDFNVSISSSKVKEDFKIRQVMETISFLLKNNCQIILISHLGQPRSGFEKKYSMRPVALHLSKILARKVEFLPFDKYSKFQDIKKKINLDIEKHDKKIFLLDNIRFFKGEGSDSLVLGKSLAGLADIYINDAFAVSHRAHSSVSAVRKYIPSYAGFLLEKELENLNKILKPQKPLVLIMGGAKIASKAPIIERLYSKASFVLLGGALANNFYLAKKYNIGKSLYDPESEPLIKKLLNFKKIVLPVDLIVFSKNSSGKTIKKVKKIDEVCDDEFIYDIGPETIGLFAKYIQKAKTIVWNGPMGKFEENGFKRGTVAIASEVASISKGKVFGVVGGGETVEALNLSGMRSYMDWVSTGGGAMLAYLSGKKMPGIN